MTLTKESGWKMDGHMSGWTDEWNIVKLLNVDISMLRDIKDTAVLEYIYKYKYIYKESRTNVKCYNHRILICIKHAWIGVA